MQVCVCWIWVKVLPPPLRDAAGDAGRRPALCRVWRTRRAFVSSRRNRARPGGDRQTLRREHPAHPKGIITEGVTTEATMTESFDPRQHRFPECRYFEDLAVGERFYIPSRTMTEAHFAAFQTLSGDNHPIHYDVEYCRERGHPRLLAHGFQLLCFTAGGANVSRAPSGVGDGGHGARSNSLFQLPLLLCASNVGRGVWRAVLPLKNHDVAVSGPEIEPDTTQSRQPFRQKPRIGVILD